MFLFNGQITDRIHLLDRGLHYGDGLFATIAVVNGQPLCWHRHLERLLSGCTRLKIAFNDVDILGSEVMSICENVRQGVLKLIITSGARGRGYKRDDTGGQPSRILMIYPWPEYPKDYPSQGIHVHLCSTKLGHNPMLAGIKHLNRLEQVLARHEWSDAQIMEGLVLDINGSVIEGTMSNLFLVFPNKRLVTPDISLCGVHGIVRQYLLDHCVDIAYTGEIRNLSMDDVFSASEMFFCNSIAGIMPVRQLAHHPFPSQLVANEIRQFLLSRGIITSS